MAPNFSAYFETSQLDENGNFLIQDPFGLREVVQPIVSVPSSGNGPARIEGYGTCFQVTPFDWLTAQHVIMNGSQDAFPEGEIGAVGFSPGLVCGTVGFMLPDCFGAIIDRKVCTSPGGAKGSIIPSPKPPEIILDVAALKVNTSELKKPPLRSPLPISKISVEIGDEVLGIGYPILRTDFTVNPQGVFEERMYGAVGHVTKIYPDGIHQGKPWPTFEVDGNWRSGMSGGPIINLSGEVVGLVSSSIEALNDESGVGFAVDLTRVDILSLVPTLDATNPGWAHCWGIFSDSGLKGYAETQEAAEAIASSNDRAYVRKITLNAKTEDYILI